MLVQRSAKSSECRRATDDLARRPHRAGRTAAREAAGRMGGRLSTSCRKSRHDDVRNEATALGVTFGDAAAFERAAQASWRRKNADAAPRRRCSQGAAGRQRPEACRDACRRFSTSRRCATRRLSGLALYDDPQTPAKMLAVYSSLSANEKRAALATLASRAPYGVELLKADRSKADSHDRSVGRPGAPASQSARRRRSTSCLARFGGRCAARRPTRRR